jgi:hypothetical protein
MSSYISCSQESNEVLSFEWTRSGYHVITPSNEAIQYVALGSLQLYDLFKLNDTGGTVASGPQRWSDS